MLGVASMVWMMAWVSGLLLFINNHNGQIGRTLSLIGKRIKKTIKHHRQHHGQKNRPVFDDIQPDGQILFDKSSHQLSSLDEFGVAIKVLLMRLSSNRLPMAKISTNISKELSCARVMINGLPITHCSTCRRAKG